MRNRYSKILCLLLLFACCLPQEGNAFWPFKKKKKEEKKENLTPYQKLFKGKKVQTAHGLMTIHKVEGKVYVEFPIDLLGREMLFASSIENTSDGGEGAPGQLGGIDVRFRFEMVDSTIVARMPLLSKPVNSSGDAEIARALNYAHNPGIFKSFKVLACTPDSTALVVDMKGLFLEGSAFTKPFPSTSANGYYGFVTREHSLQTDKSSILGVSASHNNIGVREEVCYSVDHTLMGAYSMYEKVPLTAVVNKMLCILPEQPMTPRLADSRLGMTTQLKSDFTGTTQTVKSIRYAKRWNIEPSDSAAYRRGELVRPKKQLVFYIDSLMPPKWNPYIKAGAESWNKAFEKIGFKEVISVKDFPKNDTLFNANSLDVMTIRYSASWMNSAQTTLHSDSRTGEILNASILLNANLISVQYADRIGATVAVDPSVRTTVFPQEVQGEMIQAAVAQAVGAGLGLTTNWGASVAYPVDSLRSVSFTQKYGLGSSVTSGVIINDVATEEDVRKGVRLVNTNPGPYDELVIKYLYQPIYAASPQAEKDTLDSWIRQRSGDPFYAYVRSQSRFDSDPRNSRGALGNDHLKSLEYMLPNIRKGCENYYTWFAKEDRDLSMRKRVYSALCERLNGRIYAVLSYVGGIYLNDIRENDAIPSYSMVDAEIQKAALNKALEMAKNLDWVDDKAHATDFEIADKKADKMRLDIFNGIFGRLSYIEVCTERFPETAYTASEYLDDVYNVVWEGTLKHRRLGDFEKALQTAFLESIITTSTATAPIGTFKASKTGFASYPSGIATVSSDIATVSSDIASSSSSVKPEINLAALRDGGKVDAKLHSLQNPEEVMGFSAAPSIITNQTRIAAYYFDLLMRTKDMLVKAMTSAPEADRSHYDLLLYRIKKATEIE